MNKNECHFYPITMSERFTPQQRFLIAAWYEVFRSPIIVQRHYRQRFGRCANVPSPVTIKAIHQRASVHGTLQELSRSGRCTSNVERLVMENVTNCPTTSTRGPLANLEYQDQQFKGYFIGTSYSLTRSDNCITSLRRIFKNESNSQKISAS